MVLRCFLCKTAYNKNENDVRMHQVPRKEHIMKLWLSVLNIEQINPKAKLCSKHFTEEDFRISVVGERKYLKSDAVPSINLQKNEKNIGCSSSEKESIQNTQHCNMKHTSLKRSLSTEQLAEEVPLKNIRTITDIDIKKVYQSSLEACLEVLIEELHEKQKKINFCETMDKSKIRVIFEYEFRRGTNAAQTARNINDMFGENVANERTVRRWFEKFRSGDFNLENEPHRRPEIKVDNDELKAVVEADTSQTTRELAARFDVTIPTILNHLKQIGKVKKLDKWVPHELNERQKRNRLEACLSLLSRHKGEPFLHRVVTCDEKWILFDNCERSAQCLDKDEVPKRSPNIYQKKLMVSVWWSSAGIIYYSFMKPGQSITVDVYCNQLDEMMRELAIKQPRLVNKDRPIFLQDNARPHVAQTLLKLQELDLETLYYPPYSPDLAPTDYHFFQALDHFLQGKIFNSQQAVENAFCYFIATRSPSFFAAGINKLPLRWQNCVDSLGTYFD